MSNFCYNCGNKIVENDSYCPKCGTRLGSVNYNPNSQNISSEDNGGFGWGVLGYFIPLVGLILFLSWKDEKPKTAKAAGKGALISVIVNVVVSILFFILIITLNFSSNRIIDYGPAYDDYDYNYDYKYDFD